MTKKRVDLKVFAPEEELAELEQIEDPIAAEVPDVPMAGTVQQTEADRRRTRVRMELTPKRAKWLLEKVEEELKTLDVATTDFDQAYSLYKSLKTQIRNIEAQGSSGEVNEE